jgi:ligand-binding sensor domain-containing protein/serine phosphatase RsbU (regulator of sigma subunit)
MIKQKNILLQFILYAFVFLFFSACSDNNKKNKNLKSQKLDGEFPPQENIASSISVLVATPLVTNIDKCPPPQHTIIPTASTTHQFITKKSGEQIKLKPPPLHWFIDSLSHLPIAVEAQGEGLFSTFNTEQGLALSTVYCGYKDKNGNLWFGTAGGGVSCYNGKFFTTFSTENGLARNTIFSIAEDKHGNLWFATNGGGVSCYDGKSFTTFTTEQGLAENKVQSILVDKNDNIWFGTSEKGVSRYDGKSFTTFTKVQGLVDNRISTIIEDKSGKIWFGTFGGGVSCYDGKSFTNYATGQGLPDNFVISIMEDKSGNMWFGTDSKIVRLVGKKFIDYSAISNALGAGITKIIENKKGEIWFATGGRGVIRFDGKSFTCFSTEQGLAYNDVRSITEDKNGNLWFGTAGAGVCRYDGKSFTSFVPELAQLSNIVTNILEDRHGNLWFGAKGGLYRYDGKSLIAFSAMQGLLNPYVTSIVEDKFGNIWLGTHDGLVCYDGKSFTTFSTKQGLVDNSIRCITEDKSGNLWIGTTAGVSRYTTDPSGKLEKAFFVSYTTAQGLAQNNVRSIVEDNEGNIWFGTNEGGVSCYNGKSFTTYTTKQGLANNIVFSILKDKSGNLWFGTNGGGVSRYDGKSFLTFSTQQGLANDVIYSMVEDEQGVIWFGTNWGFSGLKFQSSLVDGKKEVKGAGTMKINNQDLKGCLPVWEIYNNRTGYPIKDLNTNSMCITKVGFLSDNKQERDGVGIIWGGCGDNKLIRFDPSAVNKNLDPPKVLIHSIKINNSTICWYDLVRSSNKPKNDGFSDNEIKNNEDSVIRTQQERMTFGRLLSEQERDTMKHQFRDIEFDGITKWHPIPEKLVLPYANNNVTFDFAAIETDRNFLVRYQFILEGYDNDWSPVTDKTSATFGNIREGNYVFKVKAKTTFGGWTAPITYSFKVLPPWYRTWWTYSGCVILVIGFLYFVYRRRTESFRRDKERLEQTIQERTIEVEKKAIEIEKQKEVIEQKNRKITDSINYAKHIQDSLLQSEEEIHKHLQELFIYYQPKDIVSGDFYWFSHTQNKLVIAVADCTGHGVPGAFMSMIGNILLNEIVNDLGFIEPGKILDELHKGIYKSLQQHLTLEQAQDGMDISLCVIDKDKNTLSFAGAQNSLYVLKNGNLEIVKADIYSIGGRQHIKKGTVRNSFKTHIISLEKGMIFYMLSDGYTDQFGSSERRKFGSTPFKEMLLGMAGLTMAQQKNTIQERFENWKGDFAQTDDVLILGFTVF